MTDRCFYFGCWNEPGHFLFAPEGRTVHGPECDRVDFYDVAADGERKHLDGNLAPRRTKDGRIIYDGQFKTRRERQLSYAGECSQGNYLCHVLPNGFTAIAWWDRCQGDTRGACNSTVLLEGNHTAEEVLAAGRQHFPHVFENLARGGTKRQEKEGKLGRPVELVEVKVS